MSYRTTAEAVAKIIELDLVSVPDIEPFILVANELVTELCSDSDYSATRLELIERWLAAHFYCARDPRAASEGLGGLSTGFSLASLGQYLAGTIHGQQAMMLDTAGNLAALNRKAAIGKSVVGISYLGQTREDL